MGKAVEKLTERQAEIIEALSAGRRVRVCHEIRGGGSLAYIDNPDRCVYLRTINSLEIRGLIVKTDRTFQGYNVVLPNRSAFLAPTLPGKEKN